LREFEEKKSQVKAVEVTVNSKDENSEDFYLDFFLEFGLGTALVPESLPPQSLLQRLMLDAPPQKGERNEIKKRVL
jgi:hypothetical protein